MRLSGVGDCLDYGYKLPSGQAMCRDNRTGNMVACSSPICAQPAVAIPGAVIPSWNPDSAPCTPKQYTTFAPAPWPPKDPCIIQNTVPCLPADWPAANSGYYDGPPGVPPCSQFSGPTSFGLPVAAYTYGPTAALDQQNALVNAAPPPAPPTVIPPPQNPLQAGANQGTPPTGTHFTNPDGTPGPSVPSFDISAWIKGNLPLIGLIGGGILLLSFAGGRR